jgi:hypothetical protein
MNKILFTILTLSFGFASQSQTKYFQINQAQLKNKIMGGWAGQTIGVTFGGPYEFRFNGTFISDYQPLLWYDGYLKKTMQENPGLYDDLYMDLTFVDVMDHAGLDAPVDSFANAYAHAGYMLWHANQAGRYNILHGIMPPQSGYWLNNPHADCIDYQIESDFAGLMSPGMPNTASAISDKIGHIMNYGDGWYGGVFVGAMYTLAFVHHDISQIISEALQTIPPQSEFYQCIRDVIGWHLKYPNDWKQCWLELQKKWANDIGCPEGVFVPFDIDAKLNAGYVVMGLLYGGGDFTKSLEIATRCGQDADCNPSTVGGILGTWLGYDKIPAYWKLGLKEAEDIPFKYTRMSLNTVYETGFRHAMENIKKQGGKVQGDQVMIPQQVPAKVKFEKSFEGHFPVAKIPVIWSADHSSVEFDFDGIGFALKGEAAAWGSNSDYIFRTELWLDGQLIEKPELPANYTTRRYDICWKYQLPKSKHHVQLKILNPSDQHKIEIGEAIIYSTSWIDGMKVNQIKK